VVRRRRNSSRDGYRDGYSSGRRRRRDDRNRRRKNDDSGNGNGLSNSDGYDNEGDQQHDDDDNNNNSSWGDSGEAEKEKWTDGRRVRGSMKCTKLTRIPWLPRVHPLSFCFLLHTLVYTLATLPRLPTHPSGPPRRSNSRSPRHQFLALPAHLNPQDLRTTFVSPRTPVTATLLTLTLFHSPSTMAYVPPPSWTPEALKENTARMERGELYTAFVPDLTAGRRKAAIACTRYNAKATAEETTRREQVEMLRACVHFSFRCEWKMMLTTWLEQNDPVFTGSAVEKGECRGG
jgi:hypothetical protein